MAVEQSLSIHLVAPAVWEPLLEAVWSLPVRERQLANTIFRSVQDQHVGITPALAGALAQTLLKRGEPVGDVWQAVYERLLRTLEGLVGDKRSGTGGGVLLAAVPYHYVVLRLIVPLVDLACRRIGRSYLFCEDEGDVTSAAYNEYSKALENAIRALASADTRHPVFWAECAITLRTMSKTMDWQSAENATLPITDPHALSLFLTLKPKSERDRKQNQRSLQLTNRRREVDPRFVDAGIEGIRRAASADDIHRILMSEFMLPPAIRNDRLANNNYFVIKRPPKPVRLRDVLIVGVLPGDIVDEAARAFLKACWFDKLVWLSQRLRQSGLEQSEFRWIEGDRYGRWRSQSFLLEEMPTIILQQELERTNVYRQQFMLALRWLPTFLDEQAQYEQGTARTDTDWETFKEWLRQSWHAQRENRHWQTARSQRRRDDRVRFVNSVLSEQPLDVSQFSFVHLLACLPQTLHTETRRTPLSEMNAVLRFGSQPSRSASLTWVPNDLKAMGEWRLEGRAWREPRLVRANSADSLHQIAADVIRGWQTLLLKEMQRG